MNITVYHAVAASGYSKKTTSSVDPEKGKFFGQSKLVKTKSRTKYDHHVKYNDTDVASWSVRE